MVRIVSIVALLMATAGIALAQSDLPTEQEAQQLGMHVKWISSSERFDSYIGNPSARVWPDTKDAEEYILLKLGDRVIARIDAKQLNVDYARYGVFPAANGQTSGPLGMDGAREVAKVITSQYKTLGYSLTSEETIKPRTYLCVASHVGGVQMFDAETGARLWSTAVGDARYPTVGPGLNDTHVVVANGGELYALDKANGGLVSRRPIDSSVSGLPQVVNKNVLIATVNGAINSYPVEDMLLGDQSLRFSEHILMDPVVSADRSYLIFPIGNYVYTCSLDGKLELWSRLQTLSPISNSPVAVADGFLVASQDGTVLKLSYERANNIEWRYNCGVNVYSRIMTDGKRVVVVSTSGRVITLDASSGELLWERSVAGATEPVAVMANTVIVQDHSGSLVALEASSGAVRGRLQRNIAGAVYNPYSDRVYLRSTFGRIMCLQENGADTPTFVPAVAIMRGAKLEVGEKAKTDVKPTEEVTEELGGEEMESEANPFGGSDDNPFGGAAGADAFGDGGDDENPFN